jgi:3-oxoacyl-[acyl-carrier protein] reductase
MKDARIAIVGATSGIGRALVRAVSGQGARVSSFSRTPQFPEALSGVRHIVFDATAGDFPVEALPEALEGLVYCPGSIRLRPFNRLTAEEFRADFEINCLGAVKVIQACLPALKNAPAGASVVLFSTVAVRTGMPFHASIASAKGAVEGLVRSLAAELAPKIRVNAVAPSLTDTPLAGQLLADETRRRAAAERHPLRRIGSAEEMAGAAMFLMSEASAWMTGQILHVDGGLGGVLTFK